MNVNIVKVNLHLIGRGLLQCTEKHMRPTAWEHLPRPHPSGRPRMLPVFQVTLRTAPLELP